MMMPLRRDCTQPLCLETASQTPSALFPAGFQPFFPVGLHRPDRHCSAELQGLPASGALNTQIAESPGSPGMPCFPHAPFFARHSSCVFGIFQASAAGAVELNAKMVNNAANKDFLCMSLALDLLFGWLCGETQSPSSRRINLKFSG